MSDVTMQMENKNLVIENELVNSEHAGSGTVTSYDTELETNSDGAEGDTSFNGDTEAEIAASDTEKGNIVAPDETGLLAATENLDDTELPEDSEVQENTDDEGDEAALDDIGVQDYKEIPDEIASIDAAEDEIADGDQMVDGHDTGREALSSDAENDTEIVGSDLTKPDTEDSKISEAEITSDSAEGETASSENAEAEAADEEIATGDGVAAETPISDNPEIKLVKGGVFVPVYSDERELLGYAEMEYPDCFEDQDKVPDNLPEKLHNKEETDSGILEGIESSHDLSEDKGELLENKEQEQALHAMDGEGSTEVENGSNGKAEFSLPEGVTESPRSDDEMHIGLIRDNPNLIRTYLQVSDDKGELFKDDELDQRKKDFCERCANPEEIAAQDFDKLIEEGKDIGSQLVRKVNMLENGMAGIFTKRRIEDAEFFIGLKKLVTTKYGPIWEAWYKINFQGSEFRSVQDYMSLAYLPGIKRYSVFGKERLLGVKRQMSDADKAAADPVGAFIKRNGIDFNPQIQTDAKALNVETDIAINHQRCITAGLDIPKDSIEALVRLGKDVEPKDIKELQIRKDAGQDIVEEFKKMVASGGKLPPLQTPKRKAEGFNKSTMQFIKKVESAISDHEYLGEFKTDLITRLKEKVQQLEQMLQAITEESPEPPNDEDDSSQGPTEGGK